jgi:hypothetical protein
LRKPTKCRKITLSGTKKTLNKSYEEVTCKNIEPNFISSKHPSQPWIIKPATINHFTGKKLVVKTTNMEYYQVDDSR